MHLFFNTWQKLVNFFTYIKESVNYNSVYLISGSYTNFCTFLCNKCDIGYDVVNHDNDWWLQASFYSFSFILAQNSECMPKLNTRNCTYAFLNICGKIRQFLSGIKKDAHKRKFVSFFCLTEYKYSLSHVYGMPCHKNSILAWGHVTRAGNSAGRPMLVNCHV